MTLKINSFFPLLFVLLFFSANSAMGQKEDNLLTKNKGIWYKDKISMAENEEEKEESHIRFNVSAVGGIWIPTGNLAAFGNHPKLGLKSGFRSKKLEVGLEFTHKFQDSKTFIVIERFGQTVRTDNFSAWYMGFEGRYELKNFNLHTLDMVAGAGISTIEILAIDLNRDRSPDIRQNVTSYNFSLGVGYRFFFNDKWYVGLRSKYHFVNHKIRNGTDLAGNIVTVSLSLGRMGYTTKR